MNKSEFKKFILAVPKAELHLHLEAVISLDGVKKLYKNKFDKEMTEQEQVELFSYDDLNGFIQSFLKIQGMYKTVQDFELVFDPTLVRGMSYYTGTIFEIAMPELGAACGGGGRYDKMVGKFTGQDVPACGFSIGFERIVLLLLESGFTVPMQRPKVAYLIEKGFSAEKLSEVIAKAQQERQAGKQVLVVRMNKNKKFQKEKLVAEGYKDIVEFFNN